MTEQFIDSIDDRDKCFQDQVVKHFQFLIDDYGFLKVETDDVLFVRYESKKIFVDICYDRRFAIEVDIGFLQKNRNGEKSFSLSAIMDVEGKFMEPFQVSTKEGIREFVPKTAELVKQYAKKALLGNDEFFKEVEIANTKRSHQYMVDMKMRNVRPKIDEAWRSHDYKKVIELYESLKEYINDITPTEQKKLEFARKQLMKQEK